MPLVFRPTSHSRMSVELEHFCPEQLCDVAIFDLLHRHARVDGQDIEWGDLFTITQDGNRDSVRIEGDFSHVHGIAAGMMTGTIVVDGSVGRHAAQGMGGGRLEIRENAGDFLAAQLTGGVVFVRGNAGNNVAAALAGRRTGMVGGVVIVLGNVGHLAGARMRRGLLAIGKNTGEGLGLELHAGTIVVAADIGAHPLIGMRRGSLIALKSMTDQNIPVTFRRGTQWCPQTLGLIRSHIIRCIGEDDSKHALGNEPFWCGPWMHWHGDVLAGGRGEIFCACDS